MQRRRFVQSAFALSVSALSLGWIPAARARRAPSVSPNVRFVGHVRDIAGAARDAAALESMLRAQAPTGTTVTASAPSVTVRLNAPVTAAAAIAALGLSRAYAISGDVHQTEWYVTLHASDLNPTRIATELPHIGAWDVQLNLDARPAGALPTLVAGASPAYDLRTYSANVVSIEFRPHR